MRATEYLSAVKDGIGERGKYSHIDVSSKKVRDQIKEDRKKAKKSEKQTTSALF